MSKTRVALLISLLFCSQTFPLSAAQAGEPSALPPSVAQPASSTTAVGKVEAKLWQKGSTVQIIDAQGTHAISGKTDLHENDQVVCGANSTAEITLNDGSHLILSPGSSLTIHQLTHHHLDQGSVYASVVKNTYTPKRPFIIRTGCATMGVRGTQFLVQHDAKAGSTVSTLDGVVAIARTPEELNKPGSVYLIHAGKQSKMDFTSARATKPQKFNRKTLFEQLSTQNPQFAEHIQDFYRQNGRPDAFRSSTGPNKAKRAWTPPKPRRPIGHK